MVATGSKKAQCNIDCREKHPSDWLDQIPRALCNYKCILGNGAGNGNGNGNGNNGGAKKIVTDIDVDVDQYTYAYETIISPTITAPFTYQTQEERVYAPVFQVWSPGASARIGVEQSQEIDFNQVLKTILDFTQGIEQRPVVDIPIDVDPTIEGDVEKSNAAVGLLVVAGLAVAGYYGYKEFAKKKVKKGR